jgi:hypothetical protein
MEKPLRTSKSYRHYLFCWAISIASLGCASVTHAENTISSFENSYTAKLYGVSIKVTSRLSSGSDGNYEFYFNANSFVGDITETTQLQWNATKKIFTPQHYFYKRSGLGKNREDELVFDWQNHTVTNIKRSTSKPFSAELNIQDSLSYQVQLRQDLIAERKELTYNISNGGKIRQYHFDIVGDETLETPLGAVKTLKVKRADTKNQAATYAWFAKDYDYLLVRLEKEDNGSAYTIYLSKAALNGKAIAHF